MRFAALFAAASIAASGVTASPLSINLDVGNLLGFDLSASNHYGAPHPPWVPQAYPGWYVGDHAHNFPELPCLSGVSSLILIKSNILLTPHTQLICKLLQLLPFNWLHCPVKPPPTPPPTDGYHQTFSNLTGATQAGDYLTYGLVDTIARKFSS